MNARKPRRVLYLFPLFPYLPLTFLQLTGGSTMSNLPNDLKYAQTHEWAKLEGDGIVRVGISDFAQEQLGDVVYVELPDVGKRVKVGQDCAVVESVKAASDIYSPVSGEIVAINSDLQTSPEALNQDAYAAWIFAVQADDPAEMNQLLDAAAYRSASGAD